MQNERFLGHLSANEDELLYLHDLFALGSVSQVLVDALLNYAVLPALLAPLNGQKGVGVGLALYLLNQLMGIEALQDPLLRLLFRLETPGYACAKQPLSYQREWQREGWWDKWCESDKKTREKKSLLYQGIDEPKTPMAKIYDVLSRSYFQSDHERFLQEHRQLSSALGFDTLTNQRDGRKSISGSHPYRRDHQRALHRGPHQRGPAFVAKTA